MSSHHNLSTSTRPLEPWPDRALPEEWIKSLFSRMTNVYGVKFLDQWAGIDPDAVKREWAVDLAGLSDDQLRAGVLGLRTRPWPPTLPEFIALCCPPVDPSVAFYEAAEQGARRDRGEPDVWSSPAVYWAWIRVGRREVATQPYAAVKGRWDKALADELAKEVIEPVPPPRQQLAAPGRSLSSPAKAKALLSTLKVKDQHTRPTDDGRQWARNILADSSRATIDCVKLAQQALGRA
jgi:hypothetical protein